MEFNMMTYGAGFLNGFISDCFEAILEEENSHLKQICFFVDGLNGYFALGGNSEVDENSIYPEMKEQDIVYLNSSEWINDYYEQKEYHKIILNDNTEGVNSAVDVFVNTTLDRYYENIGMVFFTYRLLIEYNKMKENKKFMDVMSGKELFIESVNGEKIIFKYL
jgi:hypothetical protein